MIRFCLRLPLLCTCWVLFLGTRMQANPASDSLNLLQSADSLIFLEKRNIAASGRDVAQKTLAVAKSFLRTPYVSGTLDIHPSERLVINLRALDCWTLVENSLAIALTSRDQGNFETYQHYVQQLRYWGGVIKGYGSRIHYFTGWVIQAQQLGFLRDLTQSFGGIPFNKEINYISLHADKYPKIRESNALKSIQLSEKRVSAHHWYFIPKAKIKSIEHLIQEGDLLLLTSTKRGLDISHEGFAVRQNGRIHLLHASSLHRKAIISGQPLAEYMKGQKGQSGIIILRLNN